jgi:hypothetical protein
MADYADRFRQQGKDAGLQDWSVAVMQLQVLAAFSRVRARELLGILRARGIRVTVRLPGEERYTGLPMELDRLCDLAEVYDGLHDLARHVERDAEVVELAGTHAKELADLVSALDTLSRALAA